ncbi:MAG TPA: dethiobiotin synthase [Solirubrobacteraceae bacterium]|nr:dethiobiotin synthase [Solirubrobacteraceae bacterium]
MPSHTGGPREAAAAGAERAASGRRPVRLPPGLFVTGTDTGAGKTVVAAALCASLRAAGRRVAAVKPVLTGLDDAGGAAWPLDHELLAAAAGGEAERVAPLRFGPPVSPHLAAELANEPIERESLLRAVEAAARGADVAVVEGVGGLLVPLADGYSVRDLAADLGLPLVVAARPGLGTINHTLLTVEAARAASLTVRAIVLTPWPAEPTTIEHSNRETIARLTGIEVLTLPHVAAPEPALLAAAGAALPIAV